jgi:hypothetical protein
MLCSVLILNIVPSEIHKLAETQNTLGVTAHSAVSIQQVLNHEVSDTVNYVKALILD